MSNWDHRSDRGHGSHRSHNTQGTRSAQKGKTNNRAMFDRNFESSREHGRDPYSDKYDDQRGRDYGRDYGRDGSRHEGYDEGRRFSADDDFGNDFGRRDQTPRRTETFQSGADYGSFGRRDEYGFGERGTTFGRPGDSSSIDRFSGGNRGRGGEMSRETSYSSDFGNYGNSQRGGSFDRDVSRQDSQSNQRYNDQSYGRGTSHWMGQGTNLGYGNDYERHDTPDLFSSPGEFSPSTGMGGMGRNYGISSDAYMGTGGPSSYQTTRPNYTGRGPKNWKRSDERIIESVSETLERHPDIDAREIEVEAKDGIVTLKGAVEHRRHKRMAEDVIETLPGVIDIRNELTVNQSLFEQAKEFFTGDTTTSSTRSDKATTGKSRH